MDIDTYRALSEVERMQLGLSTLAAVARTQAPPQSYDLSETPIVEVDADVLVHALKWDRISEFYQPIWQAAQAGPSDMPNRIIERLEQLHGQKVGIFASLDRDDSVPTAQSVVD